MKIKEIREHSNDQLHTELAAIERRLFDLRTQAVTEKVEVSSEVGKARRDVARIKTVLRERQAAEKAKAAQAGAEVRAS